MSFSLAGKVAVVTGSGSGIGRAIAQRFAREGAAVGVWDLNGDSAAETAKLIDEIPPSTDYPLGYDLNIGDSILRLRYREGLDRQVPTPPGTVARIQIRLYPTSNVFKKGHRIRLDVSSSNYPRFDVNPNTGEPLGQQRRMVPADNTVYHDAANPSHVVLPVRLADPKAAAVGGQAPSGR